MEAALTLIREQGYLFRIENTDTWFVAHDRPPKSLPEILDAPEIAYDDAYALIDAGSVQQRLQYSLETGTLIWVYTLTEQAVQSKAAA